MNEETAGRGTYRLCGDCGHDLADHTSGRGCPCRCKDTQCECLAFVAQSTYPTERIAVALESIAKSLAAMRLDGPR